MQSEEDLEPQATRSVFMEPDKPASPSRLDPTRKGTRIQLPGLAEAASIINMRREASEARVAHSSDTDYSDRGHLKPPPPLQHKNRRSTSPLTSLESEAASKPNSRDRNYAYNPSGSPELPEPPVVRKEKEKARPPARARRGGSGSPPPPRRKAAPANLKNGSTGASTSDDDSNDLDYNAGGGKPKAKGQPMQKKRKVGR